jgi:hypothetical protein
MFAQYGLVRAQIAALLYESCCCLEAHCQAYIGERCGQGFQYIVLYKVMCVMFKPNQSPAKWYNDQYWIVLNAHTHCRLLCPPTAKNRRKARRTEAGVVASDDWTTGEKPANGDGPSEASSISLSATGAPAQSHV